MKKMKLAITAMIIAAGTFGAFAFTNVNTDIQSSETLLHWFDGTTYLGFDTQENIQNNNCGPIGDETCALGYGSLDSSGQPEGDVRGETTRP